ncbi:MAG TPA: aspartyl protease family protein, partial [Saprospiraceae bacterium]|nr:aspartyl protease family protein [Saprospiraceae bacterium]
MPLLGQGGFFIPQHARHVDLPFEYSNNFIILTLNCNGLLPLKFIFDTGAEHTVISKREITDAMRLTYEREYRMKGSDLKTELIAYLVRRVRFEMPDRIVAPALDVLVLQEDYFRFEEYAGVNVHGILAAGAFSKYSIKINYQRRVMTLYEREGYSPQSAGFTPVPVQVLRNKPYLSTVLHIRPEAQAPVKLLVDTGAGLSLLLFTNTDSLLHPPPNAIASNIGMGLGGFLEGYTGRVQALHLGEFRQNAVITYFQTLDSTQDLAQLNQRNGLIGNVLLDRFQVVFDYIGERMWLKPAKSYHEAYIFDRSGMNIIAAGDNFNVYTINHILPASPAAEAGLQRGDVLLKVGRSPTLLMTLSDVQRAFQKAPGKKVGVTVRRNGVRIKTE